MPNTMCIENEEQLDISQADQRLPEDLRPGLIQVPLTAVRSRLGTASGRARHRREDPQQRWPRSDLVLLAIGVAVIVLGVMVAILAARQVDVAAQLPPRPSVVPANVAGPEPLLVPEPAAQPSVQLQAPAPPPSNSSPQRAAQRPAGTRPSMRSPHHAMPFSAIPWFWLNGLP